MGSGKHIIVSETGFPVNNDTWRFIQQAWREPLEAIARLAGEKTILSGVTISLVPGGGSTVSNGFISYGGEILPFVGGPLGTQVTLIEETTNWEYDVDVDNDGEREVLPISKTRYLKFGNDGIATFAYSDLVRLSSIKQLSQFSVPANIVIDANYVHTDNNLTDTLLATIQNFVSNVQANWDTTNPASQSFIHNKPTNLVRYLRRGFVTLGNWPDGNDEQTTVTFPTIGTVNYFVIGSLVSMGDWNDDNEVFWVVKDKTATSFKLLGRKMASGSTNMRFDYILIPSV